MSESKAEPKKGRHLQTGVRTLIVLVATCGVTFWAARYLWESQHPAYGAARGLEARNVADRARRDSPAGSSGYRGYRDCDPSRDCGDCGRGR